MSEICCMFQGKRKWEEAIAGLKHEEVLFNDLRNYWLLYRCRKCGAWVLYEYEEQHYFTPDENWDDAYCYDRYYPVESPEEAKALVETSHFRELHKERNHLEVFYKESTPEKKYFKWMTP